MATMLATSKEKAIMRRLVISANSKKNSKPRPMQIRQNRRLLPLVDNPIPQRENVAKSNGKNKTAIPDWLYNRYENQEYK